MKEAKDLITGFRRFYEKRTGGEGRSSKNFFNLLGQLQHIDGPGIPTEFVVQNGDYYVRTACLLYWDGRAWVNDRLLVVVQPTKIKDMEILTRFDLREKDINPDDSEIVVATALIDKSGSKRYILASTTVFGIINKSSVQSPIYDKMHTAQLSELEYEKVIDNAYRIAHQAISRRSLPTGLDVVDPGVVQLKLQPQVV